MYQFALANQHGAEEIRRKLKLGNVILVGNDIERASSACISWRACCVMERFTIYQSPGDKAPGMARLSFGRNRAGQFDLADLTPQGRQFLRDSDRLALINVQDAVDFDSGNGHSYFRDSPWVSSDILATLLYNFGPAARGLEQPGDSPVWTFLAITRIDSNPPCSTRTGTARQARLLAEEAVLHAGSLNPPGGCRRPGEARPRIGAVGSPQ